MNKKLTALWATLALAGIIAAAVVAYGWLRDRAEAPDILAPISQENTANDAAEADRTSSPESDAAEYNDSQDEYPGNLSENDQSQTFEDDDTQATEEDNPQEDEKGEPIPQAPDFAMYDMYGNEVRLSDFFGKPIVLNFWTTWCPGCVVEMPHFERLYEELGSEIHIIKVNLPDDTRGETRERVEQFVADNNYSFPIYFDTGEGAMAYGVRSIPVTFFIDADGYAVAMAQGPVDEDTLRRGLEMAGMY